MARFSDLPAELLLPILEHLKPTDADTFCMLSKHVCAVASAFLENHMKMKRAYTNRVHCTQAYFDRCDRTPPNLLDEVLQRGEIALYVQRLHLKDYATDVDDLVEDAYDVGYMIPNHTLEVLSQAIENCDLIDGQSFKTDRIVSLLYDGEYATNVLLLSLLPNLVTLRLDNGAHKYFVRYVEDDNSQKIGTPLLAQLGVIELSKYGTAMEECDTAMEEYDNSMEEYDRILVLLSLLPSIKQISALNVGTRGSDYEANADRSLYQGDYPPGHSTFANLSISNSPSRLSRVTHMSVANCKIHPSVWAKMLGATTNLTSFKYCSNEAFRTKEHEAEWFCKALHAVAKDTLRHLTFYTHDQHHMGSLRDFQALESLSTSVTLLHSSSLGLSSVSKLLPRSLELLRLRQYDGWDEACWFEFMDELLQAKNEELPKLKLVQYLLNEGYVAPEYQRTIQHCMDEKHFSNAGVEVSLYWSQYLWTKEIFEVLEGSTLVDAIDL